eukprot:3796617-Pleurochrysis_carterae.AAC.2
MLALAKDQKADIRWPLISGSEREAGAVRVAGPGTHETAEPSAAAFARRTRIASGRRVGTAMRGVRDEAQRESRACVRREDAHELGPVRRRSA